MLKIRHLTLLTGALFALSGTVAAQTNDKGAAKPITLDEAIKTAFENSPYIKIAVDEVAKSRGGVAEAKTILAPKINAQATHIRQGPPVSVKIGDAMANLVAEKKTSAQVSLYYPLDITRKLSHTVNMARLQSSNSQLALRTAGQNVVFNVKKSYYDILRALGAQGVAQASVDSAAARLKNTQARYDAGIAPKFDVTRAEVELANLNQRLIFAKSGVEIARAALNNTLGLEIVSPTQVEKVEIKLDRFVTNLPELTQMAYSGRTDVKSIENLVALSENNCRLQRLGGKPTLDITGNYDYSLNVSGFSATAGTWIAMLALKTPIWDGGVTGARVDQATADLNKSKETLNQVKLGVALEVHVAALKLGDSFERVSTAEKSVALAEESLRLANVRYDAGISTLVEVTDAESALSEARFNHVNAQYDYAIAIADLQRATNSQPEMTIFDEVVRLK